jgi:trigger factor
MQQALFAQARQYPGQERQFLEFMRKNPNALAQIRAPLFEDKVVDHILGLAAVADRTVTKEELQAEIEKLDEDSSAAVPAEETTEA